MKLIVVDIVLWILASPVYAALAAVRIFRNSRFLRAASMPRLRCSCGADISLVGVWKCSCSHWTYAGHLLTVCPICQTLPCVVRCYRCGITTKLPEPA